MDTQNKPDEIFLERLAFIKYLNEIGIEQSQRPEPLCAVSVLTFHDAVELFLQLASEHLDVGKKNIRFLEYWNLLSQEVQQGDLTQKESMRRLNSARVALKHHGTRPSKWDIEAFRVTARNFFEENTPLIFGIEFSDISLTNVIQCCEARESLREAEEFLRENQIQEALNKTTLAFNQLIDDYESRKMGKYGRSPFFFGKSLTFLNSFFMGVGQKRPYREGFYRTDMERMIGGEIEKRVADYIQREFLDREKKMAEFIDKVKESLESIRDAVKILSLGIDYRKYVRFRLVTPTLVRVHSKEYKIFEASEDSRGSPTAEDAQFCIDFVVESATILQRFDFSIEGYGEG